jgi:hypothetical protein
MRPLPGFRLRPLFGLAATALLAGPAGATGFSLQITANGYDVGSYYGEQLGCVETGATTQRCSGSGLVMQTAAGGMRLDSWDIHVDGDPVVTGPVVVTNLAGVTQQFTFLFTVPTGPVGPATLTGGSVQGGMTDSNGDGVTLSTAAGSAFYTALIDGVTHQTLYADPQSFSAGMNLSGNVPSLAFGTPIPSQLGPAVAANIGLRLDFLLTAHDQASFTSNFVVEPVPEPASAALLGLGLLTLGLRARRR